MIKQAGAWALAWRVLAFLGAGCRPGSTPPARPPALHDDDLIAHLREVELEPRLARRTASPDPGQNPTAAARESLDRRRNVDQDYLAELRSRFPARYNTHAIQAAASAWLHRANAPEPPAPRIGGAQ